MFDTHIHLQLPAYHRDRQAVLNRAAAAGVTGCILPGSELEDSREGVILAEKLTGHPIPIYAGVGLHPGAADKVTPELLDQLRQLAKSPRVVAIGEIGLDYYWPSKPDRHYPFAEPPSQRRGFLAQLDLAAELGLPVIIHDREAHADTLDVLQDWVKGGPGRTGSVHAYAGGPAFLEQVMDLGFFIGMDGPVTFEKAVELHVVAKYVPLTRLLLETDGPYLTPNPYRGKRNEPAYLSYIVNQIATLRKVAPETVIEATTKNAHRLFLSRRPKAAVV